MTNYWQNVFCIGALSVIVPLSRILISIFQKEMPGYHRQIKSTLRQLATATKRSKLNVY